MTQSAAGASADFDLAVTVAQEILRLISGPKAILAPDGHCLAESAEVDAAFRAKLAEWRDAPGSPCIAGGQVARVFGPGSPLEGCRLVEAATPERPAADPALLHDLRDLLHSLQLAVTAELTPLVGKASQSQIAGIATQVENLLHGDGSVETFPLGAALAELAEALQPVIAARDARLKLELPSAEIQTTLSRGALLRLVQNLLLNAAGQSPGGEIRLTLLANPQAGSGQQLEIEDNGPGLPAERLAWLTSPRASGAAPEPQAGHGYGLAIIRQALRQIGARLEQLPGQPHRLRLHLPPVAQAPLEARPLAGRRLWLAENNAASAALLAQRLRAAGADCEIHPSGDALLEAAAETETPPDLILSDFFLGDQDGSDLCRLLGAAGFAAPVVILTADAEPETAARSLFNGAIDLWLKPISGAALIARIAETLGHPAPQPPIFDPEIAPELLDDAGLLPTLQFMQRAVHEARDIKPLCTGDDISHMRSALHSAIGASAITGLQQLNQRLKSVHAKVVAQWPIMTELDELERTIELTALTIAKIDPNERKSGS